MSASSAARMPHTELVRVGEAMCLFRPDNHAAALLNRTAAQLCDEILNRLADKDGFASSATEIEILRRQLADAGFLDEVPEAVASLGEAVAVEARNPASLHLHLGHGPCASVSCSDGALNALLEAALSPLKSSSSSARVTHFDIRSAYGSFIVFRDGIPIADGVSLAVARRVTLQALLMAMLPPERISAILHASSVSLDGRAVILAGSTGSGKSTLSMALVAGGGGYIADDLSALGADGRTISTFPIAASIKSGSWPLVGGMFPELHECRVHHVGPRQVRYLDLTHRKNAQDAAPASAIFFPEYRPDAAPSIAQLTPESALGQLLQTGSEAVGHARSLRPMAELVNATPAWRVAFSDTEWARRHILRLAAQ